MTDFRVLDASVEADRAEWLRRWSAWPRREVHAHPAYAELFAGPKDRVVCAVLGGEATGVLYPLVLRPVAAEPWAPAGTGHWDAVSPYGYGGAFAWGEAASLERPFWAAFEAWARESALVASFARLSLFDDQLLPFRGEVVVQMPNVVRDLRPPPDEIWRGYAHKVRKNVNAARRAGLRVEFDGKGERLAEFLAIYRSTMDRRGASQGYYFGEAFFRSIVRELAGHFVFAHVLRGEEVVSTELVLVSAESLYSFLGGTLAHAFELRPNDLLKHEVVEWGQARGKRAFVLGGGYGGPDGIFKYKLSFAPEGEVAFRVGRAVHDPVGYGALVEARRSHVTAMGGEWSPRDDFFPAYRG